MRPSLLHPLADKRHPRRRRAGRLAALAQRSASGAHARASVEATASSTEARMIDGVELANDIAVQRVREAGGPIDEACYPCACGYFFIAPVSTSVSCPHCGAHQAW